MSFPVCPKSLILDASLGGFWKLTLEVGQGSWMPPGDALAECPWRSFLLGQRKLRLLSVPHTLGQKAHTQGGHDRDRHLASRVVFPGL